MHLAGSRASPSSSGRLLGLHAIMGTSQNPSRLNRCNRKARPFDACITIMMPSAHQCIIITMPLGRRRTLAYNLSCSATSTRRRETKEAPSMLIDFQKKKSTYSVGVSCPDRFESRPVPRQPHCCPPPCIPDREPHPLDPCMFVDGSGYTYGCSYCCSCSYT